MYHLNLNKKLQTIRNNHGFIKLHENANTPEYKDYETKYDEYESKTSNSIWTSGHNIWKFQLLHRRR
jgi:hypothetical protein